MIEDGQLLGGTYWVPSGEDEGEGGELYSFCSGSEVGVEEEGGDGHLDAFGVEVVLGGGEGVEAQFLGGEAYTLQLIQETLVTLVVPSDRG